MPCPINLCAFTWEAFSTLVTGITAVAGAVVIGLKQLKITSQQTLIAERQADVASRQAEILSHQVQVDRAALRASLFDRRLAVYKACKSYIREAMMLRTDFGASLDASAELARQLEQAEFLFAGEVRERLRAAAEEADSLLSEREALRDLRVGKDVVTPEMAAQEKKVREMSQTLRDKLGELSQAMGDEMKLYIPRG